MDNNFTYDLLIFSARPEEIWFLEQHFKKDSNDILSDDLCPHIRRVESYNSKMNIGLVCINGMGNVLAALRAYEVIDRLLPKAVVMVGVAAAVSGNIGVKSPLKLGDVGISSEINYYSLGKKKEFAPFHEIRPTGKSRTIISSDIVSKVVGENQLNREVNELIREWLDNADYNINKWVNETVDRNDHKDYLKKPNFLVGKDIQVAQGVSYASGEFVLSDENYVKHICNAFDQTNKVRMIDMESYGISQVCSEFQVPYLTIKGVSDFAGKDKSDKYRWISTAAASATCIKLIDKGLFESQHFRDTPQRRYSPAACLIPDVHVLCPENKQITNQNGWRHRSCLDDLLGNFPSKGTLNNLSRIHEDIPPQVYSKELDKLVSEIVLSTQRLTLFFPYGALDLLEFFAKAEDNKEIGQLVIEIRKAVSEYQMASIRKKDNLKSGLIKKLKLLTEKIEQGYIHFKNIDLWCKNHQVSDDIPDISRVIIFDDGETINNETIVSNPLNIVYPLLLGENVPTYYTTATKLSKINQPSPDAIYVSSKINHSGFHTVIRYSDNSQSLVVSGVPCNIVPDKFKKTNNQNINSLYVNWSEWINKSQKNEIPNNDSLFKKFPTQEILKRYSVLL